MGAAIMKQICTVFLLTLVNITAWADAPSPLIDLLAVNGREAADLAKSLPGEYVVTSDHGRVVTKQKVFTSTSKLTGITCTRVEWDGHLKTETCNMQRSTNGVPLHSITVP
jgi:hypothetical protein